MGHVKGAERGRLKQEARTDVEPENERRQSFWGARSPHRLPPIAARRSPPPPTSRRAEPAQECFVVVECVVVGAYRSPLK